MPAMQFSSVLLPDPDGPMIVRGSPGDTSRWMSSSTGRAPGAKVLHTEVSDTLAGMGLLGFVDGAEDRGQLGAVAEGKAPLDRGIAGQSCPGAGRGRAARPSP